MSNRKESTKKAIERYYEKQDKIGDLPTRKNEKPEQELVSKILIWLKQNDFDAMTVEAKAIYSVQRGGYSGRAASPGTPDIIGSTNQGIFVAIEVKAPGRLSTLRDLQRQFLTRKIQSQCFACVVDSVELLARTYSHWLSLPKDKQSDFLISLLPIKRDEEQTSLFED